MRADRVDEIALQALGDQDGRHMTPNHSCAREPSEHCTLVDTRAIGGTAMGSMVPARGTCFPERLRNPRCYQAMPCRRRLDANAVVVSTATKHVVAGRRPHVQRS